MSNVTHKYLTDKYGLSNGYFAAVKRNNPTKYNYWFSFHENKAKSLELYFEYMDELLVDMCEVLTSYRKLRDFGDMVKGLGFSNIQNSSAIHFNISLQVFRVRDGRDYLNTKLTTIQKWEVIIKNYKDKK